MDDHQLQTLFAGDAPARDIAFVLAVAERIERRRFRQQVFALAMYAVAAAGLLLALSPLLARFSASADVFVAAGFVLASLWLVRRDLPGAEILAP